MSDKPTTKQIAAGCHHFRGMMEDKCAAGVDFRKHAPASLPCTSGPWRNQDTSSCPFHAFYTQAELDDRDKEIAAMLNQFATDLENDICPRCGVRIEQKNQVGRCVYAEPCGCRLYQGKLKK
jgi:hypothetical protein